VIAVIARDRKTCHKGHEGYKGLTDPNPLYFFVSFVVKKFFDGGDQLIPLRS
jgi:hypothetical protein